MGRSSYFLSVVFLCDKIFGDLGVDYRHREQSFNQIHLFLVLLQLVEGLSLFRTGRPNSHPVSRKLADQLGTQSLIKVVASNNDVDTVVLHNLQILIQVTALEGHLFMVSTQFVVELIAKVD